MPLRVCDTSVYGPLLVQRLRLVRILGGTLFCTDDVNGVVHVGATAWRLLAFVYLICPKHLPGPSLFTVVFISL